MKISGHVIFFVLREPLFGLFVILDLLEVVETNADHLPDENVEDHDVDQKVKQEEVELSPASLVSDVLIGLIHHVQQVEPRSAVILEC